MKIVHHFNVTAKCPRGGTDEYAVKMTLGWLARATVDDTTAPQNFPLVEEIEGALKDLTAEPIYQERLTQRLADRFGATVETTGKHGRFATTCVSDPC